jgi:phospholipid transport system transporter-binding protein
MTMTQASSSPIETGEVAQSVSSRSWIMPSVLTHDHAAAAVENARQAWSGASSGQVIQVSGRHLKQFDSSALATLLAVLREAHQQGLQVKCHALPRALRDLAKAYGVDSLL